MIYQARNVLSYTLITALLNTSFYPLYAVGKPNKEEQMQRPARLLYDITGRYPTRKAFLAENQKRAHLFPTQPQEKDLPLGLKLDRWLREKMIATAQKIQENTPESIKDSVSDVYNSTTTFLANMVDDLPDHLKSNKTFFGIDYARDRNFWLAHFRSEMNDLKTSLDQKRLEELQNIVWNGLLSPYEYEEGIVDLKSHYKKTKKNEIGKVKKEFRNTLKSSSRFVTQNLHRDLLTTLEEIHCSKKSIKDVDALLTYYRGIQNPLDYTENLVNFRQFIQRNKSTLNLPDETLGDLNKSIVKAIKLRNETQYSELKTQRAKTQSILREMPFYDADLPEEFNSSLPPVRPIEPLQEEEPSSSWTSSFKDTVQGTLKGVKTLMNYARKHPLQAFCATLYAQVRIVSALQSFNVPKGVLPANDNEKRKEPESNQHPRNVKRAVGDEFQISSNSLNPFGVGLNNSNVFVAWWSGNDITGQDISLNSTPISNEFSINQNITSSNFWRSAVRLEDGNIFTAFFSQYTGNWDIYGYKHSPNGTALSDIVRINQNTTSDQRYPSVRIVKNRDGERLCVAWHGSQTGDFDIYERMLFTNGTAMGDEFRVNQNTTSTQYSASVLGLEGGNIFTSWFSDHTGTWHTYGRIYSSNGTAITDEFGMYQITTSSQQYPQLVRTGNGNVFAVWHALGTDQVWNIYGRVFFPNGTAITDEFLINQYTTYAHVYPSLVYLSTDDVIVGWTSYENGDGSCNARLFSPIGIPVSDEFDINQTPLNTQLSYPLLSIANADEGMFATWSGNQTGNFSSYGRYFSKATLSSYLYPTSSPSIPVTPSSPTTPSSTNFTVPSSPIIPSTSAERSSSSISTEDLLLKVGIPVVGTLTLAGIGVGSYAYYKKKKRRGVLDTTNKGNTIEMNPVSSQLGTQDHVYVNVPQDASLTNQYTNFVPDSTSSHQTTGRIQNPYVNVPLTSANGNNKPNQYVSSMPVSTSSQTPHNHYENVHAVSNDNPQGNQYVTTMLTSNTNKSQYDNPTPHQPVYEGVPEDITNPPNQYASSIPVASNSQSQSTNSTQHQYVNVPPTFANGNNPPNQYENIPVSTSQTTNSTPHHYENVPDQLSSNKDKVVYADFNKQK